MRYKKYEEEQDGTHEHPCYECGKTWCGDDCENDRCRLRPADEAVCPSCSLHEQFYELSMEGGDDETRF